MSDVQYFESLAAVNKFIDSVVPPDKEPMTLTEKAVTLGAPKKPWAAMSESVRAGYIREVASTTAAAMAQAGGEWEKTIYFAFTEGGEPYVGSVSWPGSAAVERIPVALRQGGVQTIGEAARKVVERIPPPGGVRVATSDVSAMRPSVPLVPAEGAPADSVAVILQRMTDLAQRAFDQHDRVAKLYLETMGAAPPGSVDLPPDVSRMGWRPALAALAAYLEQVFEASRTLMDEIRGV